MFNRRFLRIKVFHAVYAYYHDEIKNRPLHEKNLLKSLDRAYELYLFLLAMPSEFKHYIYKELEAQQSKYFPVESLIKPLQALYENKAILLLEQNAPLQEKLKQVKKRWTNTDDIFRQMLGELKQNEAFKKYTDRSTRTFADDRQILGEMYQVFVGNLENFNFYIEEQFMNWEDDQVLVVGTILRTIAELKEGDTSNFIPGGDAEEEDEEFLKELYRKTLSEDEAYMEMISSKTENWEPERIAMVDMLLMKMALCEILYFPYIPVKVSINEYLELAKLYSTPNSHGFINGILDKIHHDLKRDHKLNKQGRGLVE